MPYTENALAAGRQAANALVQYAAFRDALDLIANALDMGNAIGLFAGVRIIAPSGAGKSLLIDCLQKNTINSPYLTEPLSVIRTELKEAPSVSQIQGGLLDSRTPLTPRNLAMVMHCVWLLPITLSFVI